MGDTHKAGSLPACRMRFACLSVSDFGMGKQVGVLLYEYVSHSRNEY
jgi:hypothetical protein